MAFSIWSNVNFLVGFGRRCFKELIGVETGVSSARSPTTTNETRDPAWSESLFRTTFGMVIWPFDVNVAIIVLPYFY